MNEKPLEDWKQIPIGDLGIFFGGLTGKTTKDFGEGSAFLTYMQVYLQKTSQKEAVDFVVIDGHEKQNKVVYGDILFTTSSETPDQIGMTDVFLESDWSPYLNSFCFGLRVRDNSLLYPPFTKYLLRGNKFREKIRPLAQGSTRFNLSKSNLAKISLLLPPLTEQKKIASILTSVDEVIEKTQKQIDKLQDLKKATMNELLTKGIGHTEFKDSELGRIPKSWEIGFIGDLCEIDTGKRDTQNKEKFGKYPFFVRSQKVERISSYSYDGEAVLTAGDGVGTGKIYHYVDGKFDYHQRVYKLSDFADEIFGKFLFYYFSNNFLRQVQKFSAKGSVESVRMEMITGMKIPVPPRPEQLKISKTLSAIENSLEKFVKKLTQTQFLKKSLMQDLLTGKVRVQVS